MNIISVGGASRSGNTLLAVLLGQVHRFVTVGMIVSHGFSSGSFDAKPVP